MAPSKASAAKATAAKGKPAPKPKVVVPAPGKSHSSREVFDEDEEMKQVENRLGQKTSGATELAIATPQKKKGVLSMVSPGGDQRKGGVASEVMQQTPPVASAKSTPIKSPVTKKSRVEDTRPPTVSEEIPNAQPDPSLDGLAPMEVEAPTGDVTLQDGQPQMVPGEPKPSFGRMDTKSTIPDIGLEIHLFLQSLVGSGPDGDSDLHDREKQYAVISEWINKVESWNGPFHHFDEMGSLGRPFFGVVTLIRERNSLEEKLHDHETVEVVQLAAVERGYHALLTRNTEKFKDLSHEEKNRAMKALETWKEQKIETIQASAKETKTSLSNLALKIRTSMDHFIDEAQRLKNGEPDAGNSGGEPGGEVTSLEDVMIMTELEDLMRGVSLKDSSPSVLSMPTLELGASPEDVPPPPMQHDAQTPQDYDVPKKGVSGTPPQITETLEGSGLMESTTPEETAMKHISQMDDGPVKSSLVALCEASVSKGASQMPAPGGEVEAATAVMRRMDTTKLQELHHEEDPESVLQKDGTYLYKGPNGRLETWQDRQKRLAHNQKMVFNRSFRNAPDVVIKAAQNKKYNRGLINQLYEDWLQSGQCWLQSSIFLNATRTQDQRKRGKFVMRDKTWLVEKYGLPVAQSIIDTKKDLQSRKAPSDPDFVMSNPDIPNSEEHCLFRVFDSLEFEDEESHKFESGITSNGNMSEEQTRDLMPVVLGGAKEMENGLFKGLQSGMVSGGGPEPTPRPPTRNGEAKPKKPVGLTKQISQKISLTSSKLTELKVMCNKVNMAPLSESMKAGYLGELNAREKDFEDHKLKLETMYMQSPGDEKIAESPELVAKYNEALKYVDSLLPALANTLKSVKMAVEPPKPKAKGKAKAKAAAVKQ